jgi:hypothetical protein
MNRQHPLARHEHANSARPPSPPSRGVPKWLAALGIGRNAKHLVVTLLAVASAPTFAHVHNVGMDIICTTTDTPPGLTLLPLLLLVGIGIVRAVLKQRKDP